MTLIKDALVSPVVSFLLAFMFFCYVYIHVHTSAKSSGIAWKYDSSLEPDSSGAAVGQRQTLVLCSGLLIVAFLGGVVLRSPVALCFVLVLVLLVAEEIWI